MVNFFLKIVICLFAFHLSYSQDSIVVKSVVDTTSIKVGEQFSYNIIIESNSFQEINFPENFNFSPFTIADQFPIDTNYLKSKKIISKKFNLTHFDEGSYLINPQEFSIQPTAHPYDEEPPHFRRCQILCPLDGDAKYLLVNNLCW